MTEEQYDLLYNHYLLDNKPIKVGAQDPEYEGEEPPVVESFADPEFNKVWDDDSIPLNQPLGAQPPSIIVPEKPETPSPADLRLPPGEKGIDLDDKKQWEEVD